MKEHSDLQMWKEAGRACFLANAWARFHAMEALGIPVTDDDEMTQLAAEVAAGTEAFWERRRGGPGKFPPGPAASGAEGDILPIAGAEGSSGAVALRSA